MPSLRALVAAGVAPRLVVTVPDTRRRRNAPPEPSPVGAAALAAGVPVHRTADVNAPGSVAALRAVEPRLLVVVAFGQILGREVLDVAPLGAVNLHFSLLPRWRGAAPVQRAVEAGDAITGVTVQRVVRALDAGPVLARREVPVLPGETAPALEERLADLGAALLAGVVGAAAASGVLPRGEPQDPAAVTRAAKVRREEGEADFTVPAEALARRVRAFTGWPGVTALLRSGGRAPVVVTFHRATAQDGPPRAATPGTVLAVAAAGVDIACGDGGVLRVTSLQRPGGRPLDARAFLNGLPVRPGDRFERPTAPTAG